MQLLLEDLHRDARLMHGIGNSRDDGSGSGGTTSTRTQQAHGGKATQPEQQQWHLNDAGDMTIARTKQAYGSKATQPAQQQ